MENHDLPSEPAQEWLLQSFGELVRTRGHQHLFGAQMILASPDHFPDPWTPTTEGARLMIQRAMGYAGLEGPLSVSQFSEKRASLEDAWGESRSVQHQGTAAWYAGYDDDHGYLFGVEAHGLAEPTLLVGTLCHEVAHAYRDHASLGDSDRDLEERLTDLTTVYLGFGVLTANASYDYRSQVTRDSILGGSSWTFQSRGYLKPEEMTFLLAAWAMARGEAPATVRRHLGRTQADCFTQAWGALSRRVGLLAELGLPPEVATARTRQLRTRAAKAAGLRRLAAAGLALVGAALTGWLGLRGHWILAGGCALLAGPLAWAQVRAARQLDRSFLAEDHIDLSNVLREVGLAQRSDASASRRK